MTPRWLLILALAAGLAGLGVSAYLTAVHFASAGLVCGRGGLVDCERVLGSPYGVLAGTPVPTAAAGLLWFGVGAGLAAWRLRSDSAPARGLHLAWSIAGILVVLGLVYVEVDLVGAICAWCTAAHALVLITLLAVLWAHQLPSPPTRGDAGPPRGPAASRAPGTPRPRRR